MASAQGVKDLADAISALGQTMQHLPTAPMEAAGRALDLAGNYISGMTDAAIESVGNKSDAEVFGHFLSQWLVVNAATDLTLFLTSRAITAATLDDRTQHRKLAFSVQS